MFDTPPLPPSPPSAPRPLPYPPRQIIQVLLSEQKAVSRDPCNPQSTYTLQTLARIAGVLGGEFLPYLDQAVTPLLAALSVDAEIRVASSSSSSNIATIKREMEAAGLTALEMDLRGVGKQLFGVNTSLMQAKEAACKTLYQYTVDLGDGFAPHAAATLAVVLPNVGPRNATAVQVVSAAIMPKLVGMASRRPAAAAVSAALGKSGGKGAGGPATQQSAAVAGNGSNFHNGNHHSNDSAAADVFIQEAQAMLDASVKALCDVVCRISGERGEEFLNTGGGDGVGGGDMEPACIAADALSTLLNDHCKVNDPSPLMMTNDLTLTAVKVLRDAAATSMRRSAARARQAAVGAGGGGGGEHHSLSGMTGAVDAAELEEQEEWEDDLLTSAVDGIGGIIKERRETFVPAFESMLKPLVASLLLRQQQQQPPPSGVAAGFLLPVPEGHGQQQQQTVLSPSQLSFGLCMAIDVLEHCGEVGRLSIFADLLPALMRGCTDEEAPSTRQACAYGLGVAADFGGSAFDFHRPQALYLLLALVAQGRAAAATGEDDEIGSVTDNSVSAAFRSIMAVVATSDSPMSSSARGEQQRLQEQQEQQRLVVKSLLEMLPLTTDVAEGHDCHRRVVGLVLSRERGHERCRQALFGLEPDQSGIGNDGFMKRDKGDGNIPELLSALAGMMVYQPSPHEQHEDAASGGEGGGGGCSGKCGQTESEEDLWERQLVTRETREKAERALVGLRGMFPKAFDRAFAGLGEEEKKAVQTLTSSIRPHGTHSNV